MKPAWAIMETKSHGYCCLEEPFLESEASKIDFDMDATWSGCAPSSDDGRAAGPVMITTFQEAYNRGPDIRLHGIECQCD